MAIHGCQQTLSDIGFGVRCAALLWRARLNCSPPMHADFIAHIGMNELAESNNLVVLYPQAIKSYLGPLNPEVRRAPRCGARP